MEKQQGKGVAPNKVRVLEKAEALLRDKGTPRAMALAEAAAMLRERRRAEALRMDKGTPTATGTVGMARVLEERRRPDAAQG